jgi:hypothetical protein
MNMEQRQPHQPSMTRGSPGEASDRNAIRVIHWIMGPIGHVRIRSVAFEKRVRARFQSEIAQLTRLDFEYSYSDGETFSLLRMPLVLPALTAFAMWRNHEAMTIYRGTKLLAGFPVLSSSDRRTCANPSGLGVKFYTAFTDGTLLVSKNFDDPTSAAPMVVKHCKAASIAQAWAEHQGRIEELEAEGKHVDCDTSFEAYAELSQKETAPW